MLFRMYCCVHFENHGTQRDQCKRWMSEKNHGRLKTTKRQVSIKRAQSALRPGGPLQGRPRLQGRFVKYSLVRTHQRKGLEVRAGRGRYCRGRRTRAPRQFSRTRTPRQSCPLKPMPHKESSAKGGQVRNFGGG